MSFPPPQTIQKELAKNRIQFPPIQSDSLLGDCLTENGKWKKMLKQNVIESSKSTWSSPAVLVTKKVL